MKKLYVSINDINNNEFWRYNTYKSFTRVDDFFECDTFRDMWALLYYVSQDSFDYNYTEDSFFERTFDQETIEKIHDGDDSMITEDMFKELCEDFGVKYLEVNVNQEIEELEEDESKPFGYEASVRNYLFSLDKEERELVALHYILEKRSAWKWAEQLEFDINNESVEKAYYM